MTTPKVHRPSGAAGGDSLIIEAGGKVLDRQPQGGTQPAILFHHDVVIPHVDGTSTTEITAADKIEIIDASALKTVTGGSAATAAAVTVQVTTSTGGAISNAMSIKVPDQTVTRAGTINDGLNTIAPGGTIQVRKVGAAVSTAANTNHGCVVRITCVKRST